MDTHNIASAGCDSHHDCLTLTHSRRVGLRGAERRASPATGCEDHQPGLKAERTAEPTTATVSDDQQVIVTDRLTTPDTGACGE